MQKSESIDFTSVSNWCNGVLRYNNWYNKSSILLLFSAFFCFSKNYKVNKYSTLSANGRVVWKVVDNSFIWETLELVLWLIGKIIKSFEHFYFTYFYNETKYNKIFTISIKKKPTKVSFNSKIFRFLNRYNLTFRLCFRSWLVKAIHTILIG